MALPGPDVEAAERYERWFYTPLGALVDAWEKEVLFPLLGTVAGDRVLEVGCGTGSYVLPLAQRGAEAVGLDRSAERLRVAQRKSRPTGLALLLVRGQAESLPFPDNAFDRVLCVTVLEFLPQPRLAVAEMWRVLKPSGVLVIGALNRNSLWHWGRWLLRKRTPGCVSFYSGSRPTPPVFSHFRSRTLS